MGRDHGSALNGRWMWLAVAFLAALGGVTGWVVVHGRSPSTPWRSIGLAGELVHSVVVGQGGRLVAGTTSGVYQRGARGNWAKVLGGSEFWSMAARGDMLVAAADDGRVFESRDGGRSWTTRLVSSGGAYAVAVAPSSAYRVLAGAAGGIYTQSRESGAWKRVAYLGGSACDALYFVDSKTVLAATVSGGSGRSAPAVLISHDEGLSWAALGRGLPAAGVMSILRAGHRVLAGTMGKTVFTLRTRGYVWARTGVGMPPVSDHGAALVAARGTKATTIYVGTLGFGVFRSRDLGHSWLHVASLPGGRDTQIVLSLVFERGKLIAGTALGVYETEVG